MVKKKKEPISPIYKIISSTFDTYIDISKICVMREDKSGCNLYIGGDEAFIIDKQDYEKILEIWMKLNS